MSFCVRFFVYTIAHTHSPSGFFILAHLLHILHSASVQTHWTNSISIISFLYYTENHIRFRPFPLYVLHPFFFFFASIFLVVLFREQLLRLLRVWIQYRPPSSHPCSVIEQPKSQHHSPYGIDGSKDSPTHLHAHQTSFTVFSISTCFLSRSQNLLDKLDSIERTILNQLSPKPDWPFLTIHNSRLLVQLTKTRLNK